MRSEVIEAMLKNPETKGRIAWVLFAAEGHWPELMGYGTMSDIMRVLAREGFSQFSEGSSKESLINALRELADMRVEKETSALLPCMTCGRTMRSGRSPEAIRLEHELLPHRASVVAYVAAVLGFPRTYQLKELREFIKPYCDQLRAEMK